MAEKSFVRMLGEYTAMVLDIAVPPLGGGILGYILDEKYRTTPWMMLGCVSMGFIAAVINTIRLAKRLEKEDKDADHGNGQDKKD